MNRLVSTLQECERWADKMLRPIYGKTRTLPPRKSDHKPRPRVERCIKPGDPL